MDKKLLPLVSVVMPVYNAERFLRQAIESVLCQTHSNIELIMVNDCSTDHSMQIMREYQQKDERIRIIDCERNQGVARVRNLGIQAAVGEYIALLDSDDAWEKTKLEKQIRLLREKGASIAYCSVDFIDEDDHKLKTFTVPPETDYKEMLVRCYFICSTVVAESKIMKEHPFRAEYYHEDFLLWTELLSQPVKAVGVTESLAYYRQVAGSRSNNKLKSSKNRWKIYREALGMSVLKSAAVFVQYAFWGVIKYFL